MGKHSEGKGWNGRLASGLKYQTRKEEKDSFQPPRVCGGAGGQGRVEMLGLHAGILLAVLGELWLESFLVV